VTLMENSLIKYLKVPAVKTILSATQTFAQAENALI